MKSIAIIDANALGHIVKHRTKALSFNGSPSGVIYGFIRKLFVLQENMNADQILFAWDSNKNKLYRKIEYQWYKEKAYDKKSDEDKRLDEIARPQFKILRKEVLPKIGFSNNYISSGLEADDIIAQICNQYKHTNQIQIVSRDNDLHQMLDADRVVVFDPVKIGWFTEKIFTEKWGISPYSWDMVKSIAGCSGDEVPGIPGVKEKTAIKFLNGELNPKTKTFKKIVNGKDICIRNMRLVKLPWESTPEFNIDNDCISWNGFLSVCEKYGFNSLIGDQIKSQFEYLFAR